jgi:hypothetical protein
MNHPCNCFGITRYTARHDDVQLSLERLLGGQAGYLALTWMWSNHM